MLRIGVLHIKTAVEGRLRPPLKGRDTERIPMSTASVALRAAIHDALTADGALTALLSGPKIYDEPPAAAAFPYVTLGEARVTDFSTGTEPGEEHQLTLHA